LFYPTILASIIYSRVLVFEKICAPLHYIHPITYHNLYTVIFVLWNMCDELT